MRHGLPRLPRRSAPSGSQHGRRPAGRGSTGPSGRHTCAVTRDWWWRSSRARERSSSNRPRAAAPCPTWTPSSGRDPSAVFGPPFPARRAAAQATLWTGAWPDTHGVVGDGVPRAAGSVLETTPGDRSSALGAEPLWVTAAREGVPTIVVGVSQSAPFGPFLGEKRHGGDFARHLVLLAPAAVGIPTAILTARDLTRRPAASWTGAKSGSAAFQVDIPVGEGTLPGLLFDDPDDPASGLDTLALSASRDLSAAVHLKPVPAGRGEDASRAMPFHTAEGTGFRPLPPLLALVRWAGDRPVALERRPHNRQPATCPGRRGRRRGSPGRRRPPPLRRRKLRRTAVGWR